MRKTSIITVANQKGGVGKTTTVVNLASSYSAMGKKVLIVDTDHQANASLGLGLEKQVGIDGLNLYTAIQNNLTIEEVALPTKVKNISMVAACDALEELGKKLIGLPQQNVIMDKLLNSKKIDEFNIVIIDTHPSIDTYFQAAMKTSHYYLVPLFAEAYSTSGLKRQINAIEQIRIHLNPMLTCLGAVITNFKKKPIHIHFEKVIRDIAKNSGFKVLNTVIPHSDAVSSAESHRLPLNAYRNSKALPVTHAYAALAGEILPELKGKRMGRKHAPINVEKFETNIEMGLEL